MKTAKSKALTIDAALGKLRASGYAIDYAGGLINYSISDSECQAIRTIDQLVTYASSGRDPFNWLRPLA